MTRNWCCVACPWCGSRVFQPTSGDTGVKCANTFARSSLIDRLILVSRRRSRPPCARELNGRIVAAISSTTRFEQVGSRLANQIDSVEACFAETEQTRLTTRRIIWPNWRASENGRLFCCPVFDEFRGRIAHFAPSHSILQFGRDFFRAETSAASMLVRFADPHRLFPLRRKVNSGNAQLPRVVLEGIW